MNKTFTLVLAVVLVAIVGVSVVSGQGGEWWESECPPDPPISPIEQPTYTPQAPYPERATLTPEPTYTPQPYPTCRATYTPVYVTGTPYPTQTPYPTSTLYPTQTPYPTSTPYPPQPGTEPTAQPTDTPEPTVEPVSRSITVSWDGYKAVDYAGEPPLFELVVRPEVRVLSGYRVARQEIRTGIGAADVIGNGDYTTVSWSWPALEPGDYYEYIDAIWEHIGGGDEYLICDNGNCEQTPQVYLSCSDGGEQPCYNGKIVIE